MFNIGDKVRLVVAEDKVGIVVSVITSENSINRYSVFHDVSDVAYYFEDQLELFIEDSKEELVSQDDFLGMYAAFKMGLNTSSNIFSLNTGNIEFIPFQFRPLSKILKAEHPRILIADEVGVGKTIEAGIILKEFQKRKSINRVIIICPKDLTFKWKREMKNRFDETFFILDSDKLNYCLTEFEAEDWPVEYRKCIINIEMLRTEKNIERFLNLEHSLEFDMFILDEAHHVVNFSSNSRKIAEYFSSISDIAVFLSATPIQLGSDNLYSLLNLLLPEEFNDEDIFCEMAKSNAPINRVLRYIRSMDDCWQNLALQELKTVPNTNNWSYEVFSDNAVLKYWINRLSQGEIISNDERITCYLIWNH